MFHSNSRHFLPSKAEHNYDKTIKITSNEVTVIKITKT